MSAEHSGTLACIVSFSLPVDKVWRLTANKCKNCGHQHREYTSTGEWEVAEKYKLIYTTGCIECDCKKYEQEVD